MRLATAVRAGIAALVAAGVCASAAGAATPTVREFSTGLTAGAGPKGIAAGPDGNLWFTEADGDGGIGRISTSGVIREFTSGITPSVEPSAITAGPDGNLWFTELFNSKLGRITVNGAVDEFATPRTGTTGPAGITTGPDGKLWFTNFDPSSVGHINADGSGAAETETAPTVDDGPTGIAAGSDGNLWFVESKSGAIGRITTGGLVLTPFHGSLTQADVVESITAGPDGNLWFTERGGNRIGRITTAGVIDEFSTGLTAGSAPSGITAGPDGNLWFTEETGDRVGRITPAGVITEFSAGLTPGSMPIGIAAGPDGNLWFTERNGNRIGRINTAVDPPRYTDPGRIELPDDQKGDPYPATIDVEGLPGTVTDVSVRLNGLYHPFVPDVEALLVGPQGQKVLLMADSGALQQKATGQVLTFDDDGLTSPMQVVTGVFKPFPATLTNSTFDDPAAGGPYTDKLSAFDGTNPNGTWKLFAQDDATGASGFIAGGWSLDIKTTDPAPVQDPGPTVTVPGPTVTNTVTVPGPVVTAPPDTTKPALALAKLVAKPKLAAFRKGVAFSVTPSEPVTLDITLSNATSGVVLAELERSLTSTAVAKLSLKPNAHRLGKPKKAFKATLRIVATDKGGNRTKVTRTITVQPDKAARKARRR